jgi:hypothetical protein
MIRVTGAQYMRAINPDHEKTRFAGGAAPYPAAVHLRPPFDPEGQR